MVTIDLVKPWRINENNNSRSNHSTLFGWAF